MGHLTVCSGCWWYSAVMVVWSWRFRDNRTEMRIDGLMVVMMAPAGMQPKLRTSRGMKMSRAEEGAGVQ